MVDTFLKESTKFRVSPAPIMAPGTCASCGSSDNEDRDYIDFGIDLDFFGVLYLCTFCFNECANSLGYTSPEQSRELENLLNAAQKQIIEFRIKEKALDDAINLLRNSGLLSPVANDVSATDEVPVSAEYEGIIQDDRGTDKSESDSDKQSTEQGSPKLSADGINDFLKL